MDGGERQMNAAPNPPAETALQKERRLFREIFDRLINTLLNWIFDLRPERAQRRARNLVILFILSGAVICLIYYPLVTWGRYIQNLLLYLLNPAYAAGFAGNPVNPLTEFINFLITVFTDAHILQYLPIFIAPFFIAQQLAAFYLADIFELEDIAVARHFVSEVAFTGSDETIRISKGKIHEEHLKSSNYLIGGPGKVIVDLDSAALFERADGTPHVIGPTGKDPGGKATIDGFERLREASDIRDHHVSLSVSSRSRDGIPVSATDVRLMFSIDRGENPQSSAEFPYPFSKEAVERIVYEATSRVKPEKQYPSEYKFEWINNMIGLIRGRLGGFMGEKTLTEYLASIGKPEFEKLKNQEKEIADQVKQLAQPNNDSIEPKELKPPPDFIARYKVTNLFSQFTTGIKGVELHWIGVGTWKTPPEIEKDVISEKHLEAWTTSQTNLKEGNPNALKKFGDEAILQKMASLIKDAPIAKYDEIVNETKWTKKHSRHVPRAVPRKKERFHSVGSENDIIDEEERVRGVLADLLQGSVQEEDERESDPSHNTEMRILLNEYRKQLKEAIEFMKAKNESVSPKIQEALDYIDKQTGHWIGK